MPELPEVRTVAKHLNNRINGYQIKEIDIRLDKIIKDISPKEFKEKLINKKIINVSNEGKWLVFDIEDDLHMIVHLRLEGKFRTNDDPHVDPKHDHIIFTFKNGTKLFFNDTRQFGTFHLKGNDYKQTKPLSSLGESFDKIKAKELKTRLSNKRIPIKSSLLDQTIVVGLGNIYVNEVLWECKIDPNRKSNEVTLNELENLINTSHEIMERSFKMGGSSIKTYSSLDGIKGEYQNELKVHMREKEECKRCKTIIKKMKVQGRGTYWCDKCQS